MSDFVEVIPLGGLGQFGMNCTALRYGSEMILVDAGMAFPHGDHGAELGVSLIVPDLTFLKENRDQLLGIILTHGHEDHVGAVSYIVNEIDIPIFGSPLTLGMVSGKLREHKLLGQVKKIELEARRPFSLGSFQIEPLHVTHSYPSSFCYSISLPPGRLIWTGDFKFDPTPVDGKVSDLHRLAALGEEGVLALFSDSTNSLSPGLAPSESAVYEPLRNLFRLSPQKIVATTFSSSLHRVQVLLDLAEEFNRKVVLLGRSMANNTRTSVELGYLRSGPDLIVSPAEAQRIPSEELLILAAGSQGEPMSALSRLSVGPVKSLAVEENDTVILSARKIPGNEKSIARIVNNFARLGTRIFDTNHSLVHVSGHGFRDDLKLMINLTRPRFFIPIHGEYINLRSHVSLAREQGIAEDNILLVENGDLLRINADRAYVADKISVGRRYIDEGILGEVQDVVLRQRRYLSEDGFVVVLLRINSVTGELVGDPELASRGFVLIEESEDLVEEARDHIIHLAKETALADKKDEEVFNEIIRKDLRRLLRKRTGKRPLVLPLTIEI